MKNNTLTIYYDGNCPLCSLEMQKLKLHDKHNFIVLENLHQADFDKKFPQINFNKAMRILHGEYQGKVLLGLNVTHRAWTLVGKGILVAPLQFPVIKQFSHLVYLLVAKYRHPISNFLHQRFGIGINVCNSKICGTSASDANGSQRKQPKN
jgi:predicted DCC family thiol-disulfide oxidoreductase YuxK